MKVILRKERAFMRTIVLVLASVAIVSCTTIQTVPSTGRSVNEENVLDKQVTIPTSEKGLITITRDSGALGSACNFIIKINGVDVAELSPEEKIDTYFTPGDHIIEVRNSGRGLCPNESISTIATIEKGGKKAFRVGVLSSGTIAIMPTMPPPN